MTRRLLAVLHARNLEFLRDRATLGWNVLLPVVLYPIIVPVILAGVSGTRAIFAAEPSFASAQVWLAILISFDAVFVTLALWTFAPVMSE